ncbi:MAG: GFA family protein [Gammaproteobacteria bacterium]|nr:GFA family protein [Gammaproteobacteria bacterium]
MPAPFSGGCRCGAVRYECSAEPVRVVHCFCTDCQKLTGTQMSTNVIVPDPAFRVTRGEAACFDTVGDSGNKVHRFFCRACGASLWSKPEVIAGVTIIKAGSMDDSSWIQPGASIYLDSAPKWGVIPEGIGRFPKMPT